MKLKPRKLYLKGKSKRPKYRGSRRFDASCRNHGSCPYCQRSRTWNSVERIYEADRQIKGE